MNILEERKKKLEKDKKKEEQLEQLRKTICEKIILDDDKRLEIFDCLFGSDLIEKGSAVLWKTDEAKVLGIHRTRNCFPFTVVTAQEFVKAFEPLGRKKWTNICNIWSFGRTIMDYGELIRIESLCLNEEETKKVINIGIEKYNCFIKTENRENWLGYTVEAEVLYLGEPK